MCLIVLITPYSLLRLLFFLPPVLLCYTLLAIHNDLHFPSLSPFLPLMVSLLLGTSHIFLVLSPFLLALFALLTLLMMTVGMPSLSPLLCLLYYILLAFLGLFGVSAMFGPYVAFGFFFSFFLLFRRFCPCWVPSTCSRGFLLASCSARPLAFLARSSLAYFLLLYGSLPFAAFRYLAFVGSLAAFQLLSRALPCFLPLSSRFFFRYALLPAPPWAFSFFFILASSRILILRFFYLLLPLNHTFLLSTCSSPLVNLALFPLALVLHYALGCYALLP